ncbi:hypothetical protein J23TS9_42540 [Paenibacillus sp. J23TS9]|uniref:hypothetical protein n=1 Tax=Paenibacillus sp. J23TS9 TaxID=2807193 RepID=UPI001B1AB22F|nr:hypothetical protein [Paenibacillus sp. J23TS9]GIP29124.1 hypothetical protein J23TS9_42540 [Paenibacillus sp. J23TS9]
MAQRDSKPKINKIEDTYVISPSQYEEGRTELADDQRVKVDQLSKLITGYYDNFFTLADSYTPRSYLDIIHSQLNLRVKDNMMEPHKRLEALRILEELRQELGIK